MPVFSSNSFPNFVFDLDFAGKEFTVKTKLAELEFNTLTCNTMKKYIVWYQSIEKTVATMWLTEHVHHLGMKVFQVKIVLCILVA